MTSPSLLESTDMHKARIVHANTHALECDMLTGTKQTVSMQALDTLADAKGS